MSTVGKVYARALLESSANGHSSDGQIKNYLSELTMLIDLVNQNRELDVVLTGPVAAPSEKIQVIEKLAEKLSISEGVVRFLKLLAQKGRLNALNEIASQLDPVRMEAKGGVMGTLISADELDDSEVQSIAKSFESKLGKPVELRKEVDEQLLAGLKVSVGGITYDGSLRGQLTALKGKFLGNSEAVH